MHRNGEHLWTPSLFCKSKARGLEPTQMCVLQGNPRRNEEKINDLTKNFWLSVPLCRCLNLWSIHNSISACLGDSHGTWREHSWSRARGGFLLPKFPVTSTGATFPFSQNTFVLNSYSSMGLAKILFLLFWWFYKTLFLTLFNTGEWPYHWKVILSHPGCPGNCHLLKINKREICIEIRT